MILFFDASALIYQVEGGAAWHVAAERALAPWRGRPHSIAVSRLSVLECKVKPLREGNTRLLARYEELFARTVIAELLPGVIDLATHLRAHHGLKTPDALQAACALSRPSPVKFITGDAGFQRVPGLDVVLLAP